MLEIKLWALQILNTKLGTSSPPGILSLPYDVEDIQTLNKQVIEIKYIDRISNASHILI